MSESTDVTYLDNTSTESGIEEFKKLLSFIFTLILITLVLGIWYEYGMLYIKNTFFSSKEPSQRQYLFLAIGATVIMIVLFMLFPSFIRLSYTGYSF